MTPQVDENQKHQSTYSCVQQQQELSISQLGVTIEPEKKNKGIKLHEKGRRQIVYNML